MKLLRIALAALVAVVATMPALGAGFVIPAAGRVDMVHDFKRDTIYVTAGGSLLRYDLASSSFLPALALGGNLKGVDISPDGNRLAVADATVSGSDLVVHIVDLDTLAVTQFRAPLGYYESGTYSVAFGADGSLLATTSFNGSGWVPLRKFDAAGALQIVLNPITQNTMLAASGDRTRAGFAEANISSGQWGRYDFVTGTVEELTGYDRGTSWFNFEIGTNRNGTQFAIPTYGGTFFYNDALVKVATIGTYAGPQPIGVAYHPVENLVYFPWATTNLVKVYDTATFTEVGSIPTTQAFSTTGNGAYVMGRTKLSADGSLLMMTVSNGIEVHQLYTPLAAGTVSAATSPDTPVTFALDGSIGNNGTLEWSIHTPAASGTVTLSGRNATYVPAAGFSGADRFAYIVSYGEAEVLATAFVTVAPPPNLPPEAPDHAAAGDEDTSFPITLSASDPEGQPLYYTVYRLPGHGTIAANGSQVMVYTPTADFNGTDSFTYRVTDGDLTSREATVTIDVRPVNDPPVAQDSSASVPEDGIVAVALQASDVEGSPLAYSIVSPPLHGTLAGTAPNLVYTPAANFSGNDSFTFSANDGALASNVATVSIVVSAVNDAPLATADSATAKRGIVVYIPVLANDSDPDGDPLALVSVTQPSRGTASIVGSQVQFRAGSRKGTYQFQYTMTDGRGANASATVTVNVN